MLWCPFLSCGKDRKIFLLDTLYLSLFLCSLFWTIKKEKKEYAPNDTESVLAEDHIIFIEQAVFIVGPASKLMFYIRR